MREQRQTGDRQGAGLCGERSNVPRVSAALYEAEIMNI